MLKKIAAAFLILAGACVAAPAQEKPALTVLAYAAFAGKYGPGGKLKAAFEETCGCTLAFATADDAGALLARLKLEGDALRADVVVGLDMNLMAEARDTGFFMPHGLDYRALQLTTPAPFDAPDFVPFDYGAFAFVYDSRKLKEPPTSLKALVEAPASLKIVVQDPRSSSVGLGLVYWMRSVFGDQTPAAWAALRPKIVTFTKGWSEAYGLFLKGEADMVLSYTTSPAYHEIAEKTAFYRAAEFSEGHYVQIEIAGALKASKQPDLAKKFLAFLVGSQAQALLPTTQWMYPVRAPEGGLPPEFGKLVKPKPLLLDPEKAQALRRPFIAEWLAATTR